MTQTNISSVQDSTRNLRKSVAVRSELGGDRLAECSGRGDEGGGDDELHFVTVVCVWKVCCGLMAWRFFVSLFYENF